MLLKWNAAFCPIFPTLHYTPLNQNFALVPSQVTKPAPAWTNLRLYKISTHATVSTAPSDKLVCAEKVLTLELWTQFRPFLYCNVKWE